MTDFSTLRQILQIRYIAMFFRYGVKTIMNSNKLKLRVAAIIAAYLVGCAAVVSRFDGPFQKMYTHLYVAALLLVGVFALAAGIWLVGAPKGYIGIMQNIYRVGLTNAASEAPVLIARCTSKDKPSTEVWEFETYGVPYSVWLDYAEKLESALDIAFVKADPGRNGRTVLLTVIPHPGPWPEKLLWDNRLLSSNKSVLVLGENRSEQVTLDLSSIPHLLTAGRTGSGKSVLQKSLMLQALLQGMEVILVDYKLGVDYSREWPKYCEIITDDDTLLKRLTEIQRKMLERYTLLTESGYANIDEYNAAGGSMKRVCIFIDEIAECLDRSNAADKAQKEIIAAISWSISSLCRLGRAAGCHVFLATQRGSADVLSGQIRSNVFKVLGSCDDNLSILTLGTAEAARKLPTDARGRFIDERGNMFQGYYSDYNSGVFSPLEGRP